jgi:hypothetical protein
MAYLRRTRADVVFSYHAILTDRTGPLLAVEADHRCHAIVEHTIADLKDHAGLAYLPSEKSTANAAWLALVGIAYNLARWTANAAGLGRITTKTLRSTIIAAPARLITSGRRLRMPTQWPWADHITTALANIRAIDPAPGRQPAAPCSFDTTHPARTPVRRMRQPADIPLTPPVLSAEIEQTTANPHAQPNEPRSENSPVHPGLRLLSSGRRERPGADSVDTSDERRKSWPTRRPASPTARLGRRGSSARAAPAAWVTPSSACSSGWAWCPAPTC